jgi:hypothetical protein
MSRSFTTRVDERAIVSAVGTLPLNGNEQGFIPAFGVILTRMYADYYNKVSYRFEQALQRAFGDEASDIAAPLLIEAGHVCAFNTFGGIMQSDEWGAVVQPMLDTREDWLHGIVGVINALGWGKWSIQELAPNEKLVMDIHGSYESTGYRKYFGEASSCKCYLATGGVAGLMNLLYHVDITARPALTPEFYATSFSGDNSFGAEETMCVSKGDPHCRIVASRDLMSIHKH